MKKVAWYAAIVLATLSLLILAWQFRIAVVLFLLSLGMAAAFRPLIDNLLTRNFHRYLAVSIAYLLVVSILGAFLFVIAGYLLSDIQSATENLADWYELTILKWSAAGSMYQRTIAGRLPPLEDLYQSLSGEQGVALLRAIIGAATGIFDIIGVFLIVLVLSMYWSVDYVRFERLLISLIPGVHRVRARDIWASIEEGVGTYVRKEGIQSLASGLILWLAFISMGLEFPALLALFAAFARLIPWLGTVLAFIPPFLVGMNSHPLLGILAGSFTFVVLFLLDRLVNPRATTLPRYSSLLLILVAIAFAQEFGLIGLLLAPPSAAAIQIIFSRLLKGPTQQYPADLAQDFAAIRERFGAIREEIDKSAGEIPPGTMNLIKRLDHMVEKTGQFLQNEAGYDRIDVE